MQEQQQSYGLPVEPERQLIFSINWIVWVVLLFVGLGWSTYDVMAKCQRLTQRPFQNDSAVDISRKLAKEIGRDSQLVRATFGSKDASFEILAAGNAHQSENWSWQKNLFLLPDSVKSYYRRREGMIWVWKAEAVSATRGIVTIIADRNGKIVGQEEV